MKTISRLTIAAAILAFGFLGAGARNAQAQSQTDPGVARVSFLHGDVSMRRGDSGETSAVTLNTPLMAGDTVFTADDARVELQLDYANILRLDGNAEANIATLDNNRIQVQVGQGLASYSVLKGSQADVEIDTPNVAVHPLREGRYRIEIFPDGDSQVTVREGQADISTSEGSTRGNKGQLIVVHGTSEDAQYRMTGAYASDNFDNWSADRDRIIFNAEGSRRTNRYYTGANDLDAYGSWSEVPDYGSVWIPTVDANWAPYRAGRWVWQPYWGWTWVSYESWGWAPYHYGRWFLHGNRWAWWPGPITPVYRPVWAPAYVSFFGFGGGVSLNIGFGFGSIGWLPTGPCDYYNPWWGRNRERFTVVNIRNSFNDHGGFRPLHGGNRYSNLRDVERNERIRNGVSGVRADSFGRGRENPRGVRADEFRNGRMMTGNLPVVPGRESLRVSDRPVNFPRNGSPNGAPNGRDGGRGFGQGQAGQGQAGERNDRPRFFTKRVPQGSRESFSDQSSRIQSAIQRDGNFRATNAGAANNNGPVNNDRINNDRANNGPANNRPAANEGGFRPQEQGAQGRGPQERNNFPRNDVPRGETRQVPQGTIQGAPRTDGGQSNREGQLQEGWSRFGRRGEDQPQSNRPQGQSQGRPQSQIMEQPNASSPVYREGGAPADSRGNGRDPVNRKDERPRRFFEMQGRPEQQPQGQQRAADPGGNRGNQANPGWQRSSRDNSGFYNAQRSDQRSNAQSNRPPLELRQPIVNPRSERQGSNRSPQDNNRGNEPTYRNEPNYRNAQPSYSAPSAPAPRNEPSFRGGSRGDGGSNRGGAPAYSAPAPRSEPSYRGQSGGGNRQVQAPPPQRSEPSGGNRGGGSERSSGGDKGSKDDGGNRGGGRGRR